MPYQNPTAGAARARAAYRLARLTRACWLPLAQAGRLWRQTTSTPRRLTPSLRPIALERIG